MMSHPEEDMILAAACNMDGNSNDSTMDLELERRFLQASQDKGKMQNLSRVPTSTARGRLRCGRAAVFDGNAEGCKDLSS